MADRVLIVDDNRSFLEAARVLLEREGLPVAGVASTSAEALEQAESLHPDIVLVDISLGEENGIDLARRLVDGGLPNEATVILISTHSADDVSELDSSSVAPFLPKAELSADAIRRIASGRSR